MLSIKNIGDVYKYYNDQLRIRDNMIKKAIDASYNMLTLDEFIRASEFKMPDIMDIKNIMQFKANIPVLITKQLIQAFGYSGDLQKQKQSLIKLIKSHNLPYIKLNNEEYVEFTTMASINDENSDLSDDLYPILKNAHGKSTHILMMPDDIDKLMMVVNTQRGRITRENFLRIKDLLKIYLEYQCRYHQKSYMDVLCKIHEMPQNKELRRVQALQILDEEIYNRYRVGVVYFITDGEFTKIGYTFELMQRFADLQIANPKELTIAKYYFIQFPYREEQRLHTEYKSKLIRGEWYCL